MADVMKSKVVAVGDSLTELLVGVNAGQTVVSMLQLGNVDGAADVTVELSMNKDGGGDTVFLKTLNVEAGKSVVVFSSQAGKLILEGDTGDSSSTGDTLDAVASVAGDLVALISYIERT